MAVVAWWCGDGTDGSMNSTRVISPRSKPQAQLCYAAGQRSKAQEQVHPKSPPKLRFLERPIQIPDFNPIEMLWLWLKCAIQTQKPSNVAELKQFCKEESARIPPQRCKRLISGNRKAFRLQLNVAQLVNYFCTLVMYVLDYFFPSIHEMII